MAWAIAAAAAGVLHSAASFYWASGGEWLLWTLGERIINSFGDRLWLLYPVAVVKLLAAVVPVWLAVKHWPGALVSRGLCWLGTVVLILWGGLNTIAGGAVLAGIVDPVGGYDRNAMIGHAWLWDPLFLLWGLALMVALLRSRRRS